MSLQAALDTALAAHAAPGAVVGTFRDGVVEVAAAGVTDVETGEPMSPGTAFLTGSITKVWATALVMTLAQEGALELGARVVDYAPGLRFGSEERFASQVTVTQLLNHSSGTDAGDLLLDTGGYPDGIPAYLELLAAVGHLHRPGEYASYNNAGWVVLEEVLRHLTGQRFDALLAERVLGVLGTEQTQMHLHGDAPPATAVGHFPDPGSAGRFIRTPEFLMPGCLAAAGTNLLTTVGDTLLLLRSLLPADNQTGPSLLSPEAATLMCTPTIADPAGPASGFALGWRYRTCGGTDVLWHGGGSYGGYAVAALSRSKRIGYVCFANSSASMGLHTQLLDDVFGAMSPLRIEPPPQRGEAGADLGRFAGTYERVSSRVNLAVRGGLLSVRLEDVEKDWEGGRLYRSGLPSAYDAVATGPASAVSLLPVAAGVPARLHFLEPEPNGSFDLLYLENRLARRVGSTLR